MEISSKSLKVLLAFVVLVVIGLTIALIAVANKNNVETKIEEKLIDLTPTCNTSECLETAKYLYSSLDENVNPCDDFYSFSCGGWKVKNPRLEGLDSWSVMSILQNKSTQKLIDILEDETLFKDTSLVIHPAQQFYRSCKNSKQNDNENINSLKDILLNNISFPSIDKDWDAEKMKYNWIISAKYAKLQFETDTFYDISVDKSDDSNIAIIQLNVPEFKIGQLLTGDSLMDNQKDKIEELLKKQFVDQVKLLKNTSDEVDLTRDIYEIIALEKRLANLKKKSNSEDKQEMTISEIQNKFPKVNWLVIFKEIFNYVNIEINETQTVAVTNTEYFKNLGDVFEFTDKRIIANYIANRVMHDFGSKTVYSIEKLAITASDKTGDVQKDCSTDTETLFGLPLSYYYVRHFFEKETLQELKGFLTGLRSAFTDTLQSNEWMDDQTKLIAQLKLNRMISYIAVPTWLTTEADLRSLYSDLEPLDSNNYVKSYRSALIWQQRLSLRALKDGFTELYDIVFGGPSEVNAFNLITENKIRIKIGIINRPYYYDKAPLSVNFGSIGYVLGHEILHGFDEQGSQYDYKGNMKMWWKNATREVYDEKVKCFVDQYADFKGSVPGTDLRINGTFTVDENIADNGGIYQSFNAYKVYGALVKPEEDLKLPMEMAKYSRDQLFFISFANTFCDDNSEKYKKLALVEDEHSPNIARVIVTLSNTEYFSRAFNCPVGTKMNPEKKCILW